MSGRERQRPAQREAPALVWVVECWDKDREFFWLADFHLRRAFALKDAREQRSIWPHVAVVPYVRAPQPRKRSSR